MRLEERSRQLGDFAVGLQPGGQRLRTAVVLDGGCAVEARGPQHAVDRDRGVAVHDAEGVARFVVEAAGRRGDLEMAHLARAAAAGDALAGQHLDLDRSLAARLGGGRAQRGDDREARATDLGELLAGERQRPLGPGAGLGLVVDVAFLQRREAPRAERSEAAVDLPPGLAEFRVTRVAERQHRERQALEPRRALADDVVDQGAGIVRRVAVAMGAGDQEQQAFAREFARREVGGADQAHGQAAGLGAAREFLGDAPTVAGLGGIEDRGADHGVGARLGGRRRRPRQRRGAARAGARQAGEVARGPAEGDRIEALGELLERRDVLGVQDGGGQGGIHRGSVRSVPRG